MHIIPLHSQLCTCHLRMLCPMRQSLCNVSRTSFCEPHRYMISRRIWKNFCLIWMPFAISLSYVHNVIDGVQNLCLCDYFSGAKFLPLLIHGTFGAPTWWSFVHSKMDQKLILCAGENSITITTTAETCHPNLHRHFRFHVACLEIMYCHISLQVILPIMFLYLDK